MSLGLAWTAARLSAAPVAAVAVGRTTVALALLGRSGILLLARLLVLAAVCAITAVCPSAPVVRARRPIAALLGRGSAGWSSSGRRSEMPVVAFAMAGSAARIAGIGSIATIVHIYLQDWIIRHACRIIFRYQVST